MRNLSPLVAAFTIACASATEPSVRQAAWLGAPPRAIQVSDTVRAGQPFTVTAFAAGSGTTACNRPDGSRVQYAGRVVRIEIFVRVERGQMVCTDELRYYPMAVPVTLQSEGASVIRIVGMSTVSGPSQPDSIETVVTVVR